MSSGQYCDDCAGHYFNCSCKSKNIKAGAEIMAGDGGYSESTKEKYQLAVEARIKSIEDNINLMKENKMNQQIIDLAKLSGFEYDIRDGNFYVSDSAQWINKEISALVELVVQECCTLIEKEGHNMVPGFSMRLTVPTEIQLIKNHFGVK